MNINVNITVPVIESDNEVLQQSRPRANASPQAEDEGMGAFLQLPTLGDARDERFNQGFLDGWLSACNHWVSYSRIEREPPMIYLYPYRRDFERSECPLSRCVPADDHSDLGGGLGRNQIPQIQQSQAAQDANLAHALPRGLGFDNLNTRELWGTYEDGLEETHEVGPASGAHQPSEGVESSVSNHASPETSEVNSNITNRVWMRGGGERGPKTRADAPGPGPYRDSRSKTQLNSPASPEFRIFPRALPVTRGSELPPSRSEKQQGTRHTGKK